MFKKKTAPKENKTNQNEKIRLFYILRKSLWYTWREYPVFYILMCISSLVQSFLMFSIIPVQEMLFGRINTAVGGNGAFSTLLIGLICYVGIGILERIANASTNFGWSTFSSKVSGAFQRQINAKLAKLDATEFESTKTLDDINKAQNGMYLVSFIAFMISLTFTFYLFYIVLMALYLSALKPIFLLMLAFSIVPSLLSQLIRVKIQSKLEDESAPWRRQYSYYESCITDRGCYKETRLLGGFAFFRDLYMAALKTVQAFEKKAYIKNCLLDALMAFIKVCGQLGMLWLLFDALLAGDIGIASFAAVYSSIGMLQAVVSELIESHIGQIAANIGKVNNFIRLMEMKERTGEEVKTEGDIVLENVTFAYPTPPDAENPPVNAVDGVSLTVKKGEVLAIVGENGSGKSTLSRLITGLYTPTSGTVTRGGVDLSAVNYSTLFGKTSAVFQKFLRYQLTLRDNVTISDLEKPASDEAVMACCADAGVETDGRSYPDGIDTMLSREFDGIDLSGGQWQRVAIARGIYRESDLMILDEPTAAIDPLEEKRIYEGFAKIAEGKSAVLITHRLGSVRLANTIAVMKKGKLVGVGTHAELMDSCEEYKELYLSQSHMYE